MGTKIINVQKSDSFEEVLASLTSTDANEVIFIFPRGTVFGKNAGYFDTLKQQADQGGKTVNIMTTDPVIAHMASQQGLGLLQSPTPKPRAVRQAPMEPVAVSAPVSEPMPAPEPPVGPVEDIETPHAAAYAAAQEAFAPEANNIYADLAVARKPKPAPAPLHSKKIQDIATSEDEETDLPIARASVIPRKPEQVDIEKLWAEEEQRQDPDHTDDEEPKKKGRLGISKKWIFIPVIAALVILGVIVYATVGSAKITVNPKTQDIDLKLKITASATTEEVDSEFNKIPGQLFEVEKTASQSYPASSEKEVAQQAYGTITISNTGPTSQRLVATTRFESKEGLIFRIRETITVPGANGSTPGTISTVVYADRAGKEYNIAPTTFTIPGFKDTPRYSQFSATSNAAMSGGAVGKAKVVSEEDYTKAKTELSAAAREQVQAALQEQTGTLKVLNDAAITIDEPKSNAKVGEAADTLQMSVRASAKIVAFQEDDVLELVTRYISKNGDLELVQKGLEVTYTAIDSDPTAKTLTFEVAVKGKAAAKLDRTQILKDVPGLNGSALESYFNKIEAVDTATILFSPFWVTKVPKDPKKIELIIDIKP